MDHDEYNKYRSSQSYTYYTLSDGSYVKDSGAFEVPYEDYWVIMFMNSDPDMQQTYLTYEINYEQINPIQIIITVIIIVAVVGGIVAVVLVLVKKNKSKNVLIQSISPPRSKKNNSYTRKSDGLSASNVPSPPGSRQNWLFCPHCGEKSYLGAQYCVNCGKQFKNQKI